MVKVYHKYANSSAFGIISSPTANILLTNDSKYCLSPALEYTNIYNVHTSELHQQLNVPAANTPSTAVITTTCQIKNSQNQYSIGYSDGSIKLFNYNPSSNTPASDTLDASDANAPIITLQGHSNSVTALAYNPHNSTLASGSQDTDIILWNVITESGLFRLKGHKDQITSLIFINQNFLLSSSKDNLIKIWDLNTQHCIETIVTNRQIWSCSVYNNLLFVGMDDGQVKVFELDFELLKLKSSKEMITDDALVDKTSGNIKKSFIILGNLEKTSKERVLTIKLISSENGTPTDIVTSTAGDYYLGVQSADKLVEIFKIRTTQELEKKLSRRKKRLREKSKENTNQVAEDSETLQLSISDRIPKFSQIRASCKIKSFDFAMFKGSMRILCQLSNNSLQLHECSLNKREQEQRVVSTIELQGHRSDIRSLALDSEDQFLASGSNDMLKIWNIETLKCTLSIDSGYILTCAFLPGNRYVVAGTKTGDLELFDLGAGSLLETIKAHEGPIWSLQVRPDKSGIVTGSQDKQVKFWDFKLLEDENSGKKRISLLHTRTLKMTDDVLCIKISPDGNLLAVALLDSTVKVFYTDTCKFFLSLYGHKLPVVSMDISSDNSLIATASSDKSVKLWGLDFGDCHKSLLAHQDSIMFCQFIWGTHYLFTVSKDKTVKLWDMDKREMIQKFVGHQGEVWALAVGKYGNKVFTGSHDRSIRMWVKTEDQFVLEEAREEELEQMYEQLDLKQREDAAIGSGVNNETGNLNEKEVGSAGLKTVETLKAGERIMEALLVFEEEKKSFDLYHKLKDSTPTLAPPPRHPLVLAVGNEDMEPEEFVLITIQKIRSSQLEESLLMLSFSLVMLLLQNLAYWMEREWNSKLCSRILTFMLKTHHHQLVATRALKPVLERMKESHRMLLNRKKDTLGYNIAGLKFILQEVSNRRSTFAEEKEIVSKRKILMIQCPKEFKDLKIFEISSQFDISCDYVFMETFEIDDEFIHGTSISCALLFYNASKRSTFTSIPEILDIFNEKRIPAFLFGVYPTNDSEKCIKVNTKMAFKIANLFDASFHEISTNDSGILQLENILHKVFEKATIKSNELDSKMSDVASSLNINSIEEINQKQTGTFLNDSLSSRSNSTLCEPPRTYSLLKNYQNQIEPKYRWSSSLPRSPNQDESSIITFCNGSLVLDKSEPYFTRTEIIEKLTSPDKYEMHFTKIILLMYVKIMGPIELLDMLVDRFESTEIKKISIETIGSVQLRVCNVLGHWLQNYPNDFSDEKMKITFIMFLESLTERKLFLSIKNKLFSIVRQIWYKHELHSGSENAQFLESLKDTMFENTKTPILKDLDTTEPDILPTLSKKRSLAFTFFLQKQLKENKNIGILDIDDRMLAEQLCILESELFQHIDAREFLKKKSQTILSHISFFNHVSGWVISNIMSEPRLLTRARIIEKFMHIALILRTLNNFNSLMAFIAGIYSAPVCRLTRTFKILQSKSVYKEFEKLHNLMISDKSYKNYRNALKGCTAPAVPYIGVYLRDLIYLEEKFESKIKSRKQELNNLDEMYDVHCICAMGDIILMLTDLSLISYGFARNQEISSFITDYKIMNNEEAYSKSLIYEKH